MSFEGFQHAGMWVYAREGGLVDDPSDPGGLTNHGVALKRHPELTADQIRNLDAQQTLAIYRKSYWDEIRGDDLPNPIAFVTFDAAINSGPEEATLCLQRSLRVKPDGIIGEETLHAARLVSSIDFLERFAAERIWFYAALRGWAKYGHGWSSRTVAAAIEANWGTT